MTVINVSNRLPVTLEPRASGGGGDGGSGGWCGYDCRPSGGGLASGLDGVRKLTDVVWVGWPGCEVAERSRPAVDERLRQLGCAAVYLDRQLAESYYDNYCNGMLWPLLHNLVSLAAYRERWGAAYLEANERFAERVLDIAEDGDAVWIHDYHLMYLPQLLRLRGGPARRLRVGFFLHTNFPPPEVFALVPQARALIASLAHADLVAFHLNRYARNFAMCRESLLGVGASGAALAEPFAPQLGFGGGPPSPVQPRLAAIPLGIDVRKFFDAVGCEPTLEHARALARRYGGKRLAIGVDRVDHIKGIEHKLRAFELFLEGGGEGVVLEQIAVPSGRERIHSYEQLERRVSRRCAAINARFGPVVRYRRESLDLHQLVALYRYADLCIVSSLSDGLNLVAFEYVAAQRGGSGALILSQQAGCAELLKTPLTVNPLDAEGFAAKIRDAIRMSEDDRVALQESLLAVVVSNTSEAWAHKFALHLGHKL